MLKAASAAGIVWASPALDSVTAHAAGTCTSAQFNAAQGAEATTASSADAAILDSGCSPLPGCGPSGSSSMCTCSFSVGQPAVTSGSWSGLTYTNMTCKIIAGQARAYDLTQSGCGNRWICVSGMVSGTGASVSFPAAPAGYTYWKFRMVLCC